jgi:hypothetical protein
MNRPIRDSKGRGNLRVLSFAQESELVGAPPWLMKARSVNDPNEVVFFDSVAERETAWEIHEGRIMAAWSVRYRRPRCWWLARGEWPGSAASELVELVRMGELTPRERTGLGDHLTPANARSLARLPEVWEDPGLRDEVLHYGALLAGLTPLGRDAFLDSLPRKGPNLPERLHRTGGGA